MKFSTCNFRITCGVVVFTLNVSSGGVGAWLMVIPRASLGGPVLFLH